jgi:DNA-binding NtrC family response regulator
MDADSCYRAVLIIDDDPDIREALSSLVGSEAFRVTEAANAIDALDICNRETFDTILCDIHMPQMSGIEFLEELRIRNNDTPVVFVTGAGSSRTFTLPAMRLGAFDFIEKPWSVDTVKETLFLCTEYGMRLRRIAEVQSVPSAERSAQMVRQLELDKKFVMLSPVVNNKKRASAS